MLVPDLQDNVQYGSDSGMKPKERVIMVAWNGMFCVLARSELTNQHQVVNSV